MKRPTTPLLVRLHVCSPAVFPMSSDRNILILTLSYLTLEKSPASDQIGSPLKPWYKFTWCVDLGETNAHTGRLDTPKGTSCEEKMICAFLNCSIYCATTVCFSAVEKPKLQGVVLRFGPTGVSLCKQVLSGLLCVIVAKNPKSLRLLNFATLLQCVLCVCSTHSHQVLLKFSIVELLKGRNSTHMYPTCPSKHSCSCVPTSPLWVWTLLPRIPLAKQTMQVSTAAVASLCSTVLNNY